MEVATHRKIRNVRASGVAVRKMKPVGVGARENSVVDSAVRGSLLLREKKNRKGVEVWSSYHGVSPKLCLILVEILEALPGDVSRLRTKGTRGHGGDKVGDHRIPFSELTSAPCSLTLPRCQSNVVGAESELESELVLLNTRLHIRSRRVRAEMEVALTK